MADARRPAIWPGAVVTTQLRLVDAADRDTDPQFAALREVLLDVWAVAPEHEAKGDAARPRIDAAASRSP